MERAVHLTPRRLCATCIVLPQNQVTENKREIRLNATHPLIRRRVQNFDNRRYADHGAFTLSVKLQIL